MFPVSTTMPSISSTVSSSASARPVGGERLATQDDACRGAVVRDGVRDLDPPVDDPRVDDLEAHPDVIGRCEHVGDADAGAGERATEHERRLDLDLRVDQRAEVEGAVFVEHHRVEKMTVVGLAHAEELLHRLRGESHLTPDDALAALHSPLDVATLDGVGIAQGEPGIVLRERRDRATAGFRVGQRIGAACDNPGICGAIVHAVPPRRLRRVRGMLRLA